MTASLKLPPEPSSVPAGRRFVAQVLTDWGLPGVADTAALLTSELLTNSVLHARTPIVLTLRRVPGSVEVVVRDASSVAPRQRKHALDGTTGRGLELLNRLALAWDVTIDGEGKSIRFTLSDSVDAWAAAD